MDTVETIHLFVCDGLADWEVGYVLAHLHTPPPYFQGQRRFQVCTVALTGAPIKTMGGLTVTPDQSVAQTRPSDSALLILPGSTGWDRGDYGEALDLAKRFVSAGKPVAAICGATAGLARAGMLDHIAHTSDAAEYLQATGYAGGQHYLGTPAVTAENVITAASTAPIAFARAIFAKLGLANETVLTAWEGLFSTGKPEYYYALMG